MQSCSMFLWDWFTGALGYLGLWKKSGKLLFLGGWVQGGDGWEEGGWWVVVGL